MQRICILFILAFICHETIQDENDGKNDGEPEYDPESDEDFYDEVDAAAVDVDDEEDDTLKYLMLMPENLEDSSHIEFREINGDDDVMEVPDSVWDDEKIESNTTLVLRQSGSPPPTACLNIKVIYSSGWVQSSAGGNTALAKQRALDVIAETEKHYTTKFSSANQLGTHISFNIVGGAPVYDSSGSYQANAGSIGSSAIRSQIATNSYSTQHYVYLTGNDGIDAVGIAYLGSACFRNSNDQKYKVSIIEWWFDVAHTASVLAHEMAHALGMNHDFGPGGLNDIKYDSSGNSCTGINGVLDYRARSQVDKFSTCSKEEFAGWYSRVVATYGSFCLGSSTCSQTPTPTATTQTPTTSRQCNGVPSTDWGCCSSSNPCNVGGGDCDYDSHCVGSLTCGNNNCRRDYSSSGSNWAGSADCCEGQATPPAERCSGVDGTDWNCCSSSNPCNAGGGDCDYDSHCAGSLTCGSNNCRGDYSLPGTDWPISADCCTDQVTTTPIPTTSSRCNGVPSTGWSCCSSSNPCIVGGGDCDYDSHCVGSLTCGNNNCRRDFSSTGSGWSGAADCCKG